MVDSNLDQVNEYTKSKKFFSINRKIFGELINGEYVIKIESNLWNIKLRFLITASFYILIANEQTSKIPIAASGIKQGCFSWPNLNNYLTLNIEDFGALKS